MVTRPHTALVIPLPTPPVMPTGEPVHYDSNTRSRRHTIKLESYAGQGASLEAFLAKYEEHSRYHGWNDDDRVFHLKNCLTGTAATVLWAGGIHSTATQLIALLKNQTWNGKSVGAVQVGIIPQEAKSERISTGPVPRHSSANITRVP